MRRGLKLYYHFSAGPYAQTESYYGWTTPRRPQPSYSRKIFLANETHQQRLVSQIHSDIIRRLSTTEKQSAAPASMKLGEVNAVGLAVGPPELEQMRSESCRSGSRPVKKHAGDYLGSWMLELAKATVKNLSSSELLGPRERRRARIAIGLGWSRRRSGPLVHAAAPTGSNDRSGGDDGLGQISIASRDRNRVSTNRSPDSRNGARQSHLEARRFPVLHGNMTVPYRLHTVSAAAGRPKTAAARMQFARDKAAAYHIRARPVAVPSPNSLKHTVPIRAGWRTARNPALSVLLV